MPMGKTKTKSHCLNDIKFGTKILKSTFINRMESHMYLKDLSRSHPLFVASIQ